jgi:hypothetical protein
MSRAREITSDSEIKALLQEIEVIAVLGATPKAERASHEVASYLHRRGYAILPVTPAHAGKELWGESVRASLSELDRPVDVVDVFRRAEALEGHLDEILAMRPHPRVVWLQLGIENQPFTERLLEEGIAVVQNRCIKQEHQRLIGG